jgi:CubicO group peptidase (beta-lactamase class C family)
MIDGTTYFSGAAGLWSTAEDYLKFGRMLLNGGELNGKRLLKSETVKLMTSNHVGDLFTAQFNGLPKQGMGFGYSVATILDKSSTGFPFPNGSFMWIGAGSSWFWVVPNEKMIFLLMCPATGTIPVHADVVKALGNAVIEKEARR